MSQIVPFLPLVSVVALVAMRLEEMGTRRDTVPGPARDTTRLKLFTAIGLLIAAGSMTQYVLEGMHVQWVWFALGWIGGLCSFWVRRTAIAALGRFWSMHVEIRENHQFVQSGPFRYMRHPVYFSMILELLAFVFLCHAWWATLGILFLYGPVLRRRLQLEEAALDEKFGSLYEEYRKTTPALIPVPW
jgi:protein-S-isoprenylcysteine O-methyltransferase Ste14